MIPLVGVKVWNLTGVFQDGHKEDGRSPFHGEDKEQWGQGVLGEVLAQRKKDIFYSENSIIPWNHHSLEPSFLRIIIP